MFIPFITVEGPIGVGKTSLSKAIMESKDFHLLKEIVDENPFLTKFYEDIGAWSFQTEMFFLCNRYKQLTDLKRDFVVEKKPVVADYHIFKNLIFAKQSLDPIEYKKYVEIYNILTKDTPVPNIIIYLHASQETLLKRIAKRGREFEKNMDTAYLVQLAQDYDVFMQQFEKEHPEIPVLRFDGDDINFVENERDLKMIVEVLESTLQKVGFPHEQP